MEFSIADCVQAVHSGAIVRLAALAVASAAVSCGGSGDGGLTGDAASSPAPAVAEAGPVVAFGAFDGGGSPGVSVGDAGCAKVTAEVKRQPAYMIFVLDGSDSMRQENKWAAVVPALKTIFAEMTQAADPGVAVGLIVFPDLGGPYPGVSDVPLGFVDAKQNAALDARLSAMLRLSTPTKAALNGGYAELEAFQPMPPLLGGGKKVLVLITDGVPTDACSTARGLSNYSTNPCVDLARAKLSEASPQGPIETFVIGVGDFPSRSPGAFDPRFLGNVAQAGGTGAAACNPNETTSTADLCYFEIDPSKSQTAADLQQKFVTALDVLRGQVVSCTFPLVSTGLGMLDPGLVNVEVAGKAVLQDATNGWTYDTPAAPTAIVLNGAACASVKSNPSSKVSVVVGCATMAK